MTRLMRSMSHVKSLLEKASLEQDASVRELLELTKERRSLDLSDLSPAEQAKLISSRSQKLHPGVEDLEQRLLDAVSEGKRIVAKFGIDPTGADVHLGHAVPMIMLSRLQRMGHRVVFIVGDITAKIGDPSGRSDERPPLTDQEIAKNLATYRRQADPIIDFENADFQHNSDWLNEVNLPRIIESTSQVSLSMLLQREDFRTRLEAGHGLSLAELMYPIAMALDSVELQCDIEVGGVDQFLNMQVCRKLMQIHGQAPELVVTTPIIEGTDGTGAKMSKSKNNYVPLSASSNEIYGKIMSVPDSLLEPYFQNLSEWSDSEIVTVRRRVDAGTLRPVDVKAVLAAEITAALHGVDQAMRAREEFTNRFSKRRFSQTSDVPVIESMDRTVLEVVRGLGFAGSNSAVRRVAEQNGLRIVREGDEAQEQLILSADDMHETLSDLLKGKAEGKSGQYFLKVGRKLARLGL